MKFTGIIIAKAWEIRKSVASELGCKINDVVWGECLKMASGKVEAINVIVKNDKFEISVTYGASVTEQENRLDVQLCSTTTIESIVNDIKITAISINKVVGYGYPTLLTDKDCYNSNFKKAKTSGATHKFRTVALMPNTAQDIKELIDGAYEQIVNQLNDKTIVLIAKIEEEKEIDKKNADLRFEEDKKEYARKIANGWCPKCDSYCYGDCEAN